MLHPVLLPGQHIVSTLSMLQLPSHSVGQFGPLAQHLLGPPALKQKP